MSKQETIDKQGITEADLLANPVIMKIVNDLPILDYKEFLEPIKISGEEILSWSAEGIKAFSLIFKVSVDEIKLFDPPEHLKGEGMMFSAMGTNHIVNITAPGIIYQPFKEFGKPNLHWVEKGTTRIKRNIRRDLIPSEMLKQRLQNAIKNAEKEESAINQLMAEVTATWDNIADDINPLTKGDCLKAAGEMYGAKDTWDEIMWKQFIVDLRAHENNYLNNLRNKLIGENTKAKSDEMQEREPGEEG